MADLHPEVEKMVEAGPQRLSTCPMCKGSGKRVSRGFTGNEATHGCRICNATGRMVETTEEFARRIAALQQDLEREECAKVCEKHEEDWHDTDWEGGCMDAASVLAAAIRQRGGS